MQELPDEDSDWHLTATHIQILQVLQVCIDLSTSDTDMLARFPSQSPETVKTYFREISRRLETHDRAGAIITAMRYGFITINRPSLSPRPAEE